ncbi:MAG: translocation/assembly module TamB domain-containing protein [Chlamydiia bacterium]
MKLRLIALLGTVTLAGGTLLLGLSSFLQRSVTDRCIEALAAEGVTAKVEEVSGWWPWHIEFRHLSLSVDQHQVAIERLDLTMTPIDWFSCLFDRWSWSRLEVEGVVVDQLPSQDLRLADGWVSWDTNQWNWHLAALSKDALWHTTSGQWSGGLGARGDEWMWTQEVTLGTDGAASIVVTGVGSEWTASVDSSAQWIPHGLRDTVECRLKGDATGIGTSMQGALEVAGLWDREGSIYPLEGKLNLKTTKGHELQITGALDSPLGKLQGNGTASQEHLTGQIQIDAKELKDLRSCVQSFLPITFPDVQGSVQARIDLSGSPHDPIVGVEATFLECEWQDWDLERLVLHGAWKGSDWTTPDQLQCSIEGLWWRQHLMQKATGTWSAQDRSYSFSAEGRCAGAFHLTGSGYVRSELSLDDLEGVFFGQNLSLTTPWQLPSTWTRDSELPLMDLNWGDGHLTAQGSLSDTPYLQLKGSSIPLEWAGLMVDSLECTGLGDIDARIEWCDQKPRLRGTLHAEEAQLILGMIHGRGSADFSIDTYSEEIELKGSVELKEAQLMLASFDTDPSADFDLEWVHWRSQPEPTPDLWPKIRYQLDVTAPASTPLSCGPLVSYWSGHLSISGDTTEDPSLEGSFKLSRGKIDLWGIPLHLREGLFKIEGVRPEEMQLFLSADTPLPQGNATINCSGPVSEPVVTIAGPAEMTAVQLVEQFAKLGEQATDPTAAKMLSLALQWLPYAAPQVMKELKQLTGLDQIELTSNRDDPEQIRFVLGKQITNRILVQLYETIGTDRGGMSFGSGVAIEASIGRSFTLQAEVNQQARSRMSLRWTRHY